METLLAVLLIIGIVIWRAWDNSRPFTGSVNDIDSTKMLLDKASPREKYRRMRKGYYNK